MEHGLGGGRGNKVETGDAFRGVGKEEKHIEVFMVMIVKGGREVWLLAGRALSARQKSVGEALFEATSMPIVTFPQSMECLLV
jgi:hypothetical protein